MWGVLCTAPLREVSFHRKTLRSHVLKGGASSQDEGGTRQDGDRALLTENRGF